MADYLPGTEAYSGGERLVVPARLRFPRECSGGADTIPLGDRDSNPFRSDNRLCSFPPTPRTKLYFSLAIQRRDLFANACSEFARVAGQRVLRSPGHDVHLDVGDGLYILSRGIQ